MEIAKIQIVANGEMTELEWLETDEVSLREAIEEACQDVTYGNELVTVSVELIERERAYGEEDENGYSHRIDGRTKTIDNMMFYFQNNKLNLMRSEANGQTK